MYLVLYDLYYIIIQRIETTGQNTRLDTTITHDEYKQRTDATYIKQH